MTGVEMYFVKFQTSNYLNTTKKKNIKYFNFEAADKLKSTSNFSPSHIERFDIKTYLHQQIFSAFFIPVASL